MVANSLIDSYKHKGLRRALVQKVKSKGITDQNVLAAIEKVPRHFFFDDAFLQHAYQDKAFPIGQGQTISQPYTVAFQSQLLEVKKDDRILEIGTGSGYQACVLIEMGAKVFTIEYNEVLYKRTKAFLPKIGYSARFKCGDGSKGWSALAPYDGIIVTAGAPSVPEELIRQLSVGGKLVIPVGDEEQQAMIKIIRNADGSITKMKYDNFRFVPLLGKFGWRN